MLQLLFSIDAVFQVFSAVIIYDPNLGYFHLIVSVILFFPPTLNPFNSTAEYVSVDESKGYL